MLLSAHGRGRTTNIYRRAANDPNALFFRQHFQIRQETDIWLHSSYWGGQTPTAQSHNTFWQFSTLSNGRPWSWTGTLHVDPVITDQNNAHVQNCGGINTNLTGGGGTSGILANSLINLGGVIRDVRIQQEAAIEELQENNLEEAVALFEPVAAISNAVRDTANAAVRYFIDVARVMATGEQRVAMRSKSNRWLPKTLVKMPTNVEKSDVFASPNPANDAVQLTVKSGNYHLRVSNAVGQTIFTQNTEGPLSVNVVTWTNGIYLFELTDKVTNKQQRSKIVVQH